MADYPKDEWIDLNGLQFHYRDWGGSGQQIVLLHGLASTCHIWDLVAPILANQYSVLALDQRGHGQSAKPDYGYDFKTVGDDLHAFINALNIESPVIAGHSWGGDVALEYAVANPQVPKGLCFVDGGTIEISGRPGATLEQAKEQMAPPYFNGVTVDQIRERASSRGILDFTSPRFEEMLLANFDVQEDNTIRARLSRENHMRIIEALWDHRPSELYPDARLPVLLMPARREEDDPEATRRFRREESIATASKLLPISDTVWLEDSIHDVPIQRPELVADVISEHFDNGFFEQRA